MSDSESDTEIFTARPRVNIESSSSDDDDDDDALFTRRPLLGKRKKLISVQKSAKDAKGAAPASAAETPAAVKHKAVVSLFDDFDDSPPAELGETSAKRSRVEPVEPDQATCEMMRRNREALEELRKESAIAIDDDDDEVIEVVSDEEPPAAEPLSVTLRTQDWKEIFSILKNAPLKELFATFRASPKGMLVETALGRPPRFLFDGDALKETDTPEGLDMDEGDVIDVR